MRIIRRATYRTMPWKNGGGETTEIAVSPEGASFENFDWRVSMARVASDGPFSVLPGVDRTLTVLEGNGVTLLPEERGAVTLTCDTAPFSFPADWPLEARLTEGPLLDLNVMTRRGRCRSFVSCAVTAAPIRCEAKGDTLLLLLRGGAATLYRDMDSSDLGDGDAVLLSRTDGRVSLRPAQKLAVHMIDLWAAG